MRRYKPYLVLAVSNFFIAGILIAAYSPGLLCLRPSDTSILRAGLAVLIAPFCILAMVWIDWQILAPKKQRVIRDTSDITMEDVEVAMHNCQIHSAGSIHTLDTLQEQLDRMEDKIRQAESLVADRFESRSHTYSRYHSILQLSYHQMLETVLSIIRQLSIYDGNAHKKLELAEESGKILTDMEESQKDMMDKLKGRIGESMALNEKMLLRIDQLSMELVSQDLDMAANDALLDEIRELTESLRYYQ